jgi:hypothetical protein
MIFAGCSLFTAIDIMQDMQDKQQRRSAYKRRRVVRFFLGQQTWSMDHNIALPDLSSYNTFCVRANCL